MVIYFQKSASVQQRTNLQCLVVQNLVFDSKVVALISSPEDDEEADHPLEHPVVEAEVTSAT